MKKYVKLSLSDRNVESLCVLGSNVGTSMDGNLKFPNPPVVIADLTTAVSNLTATHKLAVKTNSKVDFSQERTERIIVENMLRPLGAFVDSIAQGDENVILAAGMPASKTRESRPAPSKISDFTASFTGITGTILLLWKRPKYATMFKVYMSTDPSKPELWTLLDTINVRKIMVKNLASGQRFFFKVVPVGTGSAVGPASEIADELAA